ncbi:Major Facilitator Superfamily [Nesidiocoris tenuis]|uniref:Major Facilitator Superfamily n=1 Tax=Nesidiocoris tenuis TaxID=355587 RepID=A0ABN7B9Y8_9HEMI|nr:Major Facilitator Superfamily [Nesidiocoris tenuis]
MDEKKSLKETKAEDEEDGETTAEDSKMMPAHTITTYVTVPPDGGWGWVVVAASFVCNMVVDGIVFSFAPLLSPIAKEFNVSQSKATIAGSLLSGFYLISGPFVSAVANRYGFRFTGIVGSILASFIIAIASLAKSIEFLWLFYGVLGGIGFGMIYVPAVITTGFYFEKWRALATGISVTGTGIGTIVMGPLVTLLIQQFGWRGALLAQAGIVLSCVLFSALYRPLKPIRVCVPSTDVVGNGDKSKEVPLMERIRRAREHLKRTYSTISIENEVGITAVQPVQTTILRANNNVSYPTAAEIFNNTDPHSKDAPKPKQLNKVSMEKRHSIPLNSTSLATNKKSRHDDDDYDPIRDYENEEELLAAHFHDDVFYFPRKMSNKNAEVRRNSITIKYRSRTMSDSSYKDSGRRNTMSRVDVGVRPLYRDDIFFAASLNRLPQYASKCSGLDYTMSVTRLPTWNDVQEEEDATCQLCPEAVRRTLATMLDMTLLKSPVFMLFAFAGFATMLGIFVPFVYLSDRAISWGYDPSTSIFLLSTIGITNTIGRIMCGAITSVPGISALAINNIALTVGGLATIFSAYSQSHTFQFAYAAIFGFSISCWASLRSIIVVDLIGIEKLTNAFGLILMFQGFAATMGAPIAGVFLDITGSYEIPFYLSGGLLLFSGVICYPLNYLNDKMKNRQGESDDSEAVKGSS